MPIYRIIDGSCSESASIWVILLRKMTEFTATGSISLPAWRAWQNKAAFAFQQLPMTRQKIKVQQVAEELGVCYVIEGSVRKAGDMVRITAQLIDAISGKHLWAERYDRKLEDIFSVQDEITKQT